LKRLTAFLTVLLLLGLSGVLQAQPLPLPSASGSNIDVARWLKRLQDSTLVRAYMGTFVVSAGDVMSTSRIWHVCDGQQQIERVDALTGTPRSTFRHNDAVVTFLPDSRTVIQETRDSLGLFPHLLQRTDTVVARFYQIYPGGHARVAGLQADVVELVPVDKLRFGYRIWTDRASGLIVKLQTLDAANKVLEQAAFSELQFNAPLSFDQLKVLMNNTQGYQVRNPRMRRTTVDDEGWTLNPPVPGFSPVRCYARAEPDEAAGRQSLQCIFSDGLASVSLFIEPFDPQHHRWVAAHESLSMGATQLRMRQSGQWWLTAVGEVPASTLTGFLQALERKK